MERYSCKHWVQLLFDSGSSSPGAVFVFSSGSGPGGSGKWHADRDKHWVQLLFDSSSSSPVAFFFFKMHRGWGPFALSISDPYIQALIRRTGVFL